MVIEALLPTLVLVATDHTVGDIPAAIDFGLGSPATRRRDCGMFLDAGLTLEGRGRDDRAVGGRSGALIVLAEMVGTAGFEPATPGL
jgi:hypothetical protein